VPESAPVFADHFPRRPVFPGTLLMHTNLQLAARLAEELPPPATGARWTLSAVSNVKIRTFSPPGEILEVEVQLKKCSEDSALMSVETRNANRTVSAARVHFTGEGRP
jgi:3-hydroxymyristoyl/3-hydroxydecanoyl-(acyl carrier protein) dehydratase